jgi:Txe/YoeB family toxin of Txe-Axe toxin-antitoxin module
VPAHEFLLGCPTGTRAKLLAVLEVVRAAPPPAFSGGGKWEAMHGKMSGYYEIRTTGPGRRHYRLYCILDNGAPATVCQESSSTSTSRSTSESSPGFSARASRTARSRAGDSPRRHAVRRRSAGAACAPAAGMSAPA